MAGKCDVCTWAFLKHSNGRVAKIFGATLKPGSSARDAWLLERQQFIDEKNAAIPGHYMKRGRQQPDSAMGPKQCVDKVKQQRVNIEECVGNFWTPALLDQQQHRV